jgi:hypothetical protein
LCIIGIFNRDGDNLSARFFNSGGLILQILQIKIAERTPRPAIEHDHEIALF